jgi:hypothetical protein
MKEVWTAPEFREIDLGCECMANAGVFGVTQPSAADAEDPTPDTTADDCQVRD